MRTLAAGLFSLFALASAPPIVVRVEDDGLLDVETKAAPVADVLDRLAERTGMRVTYDGVRPQALVTLDIHRRSQAEVVRRTLEGLGLSYALATDESGRRVTTLIVNSSASSTITRAPAPPIGPDVALPAEAEESPADTPAMLPGDTPAMPGLPRIGMPPMVPAIPGSPPATSSPGMPEPPQEIDAPSLPYYPSNPAPPPTPQDN
jgi:hypothetical protein